MSRSFIKIVFVFLRKIVLLKARLFLCLWPSQISAIKVMSKYYEMKNRLSSYPYEKVSQNFRSLLKKGKVAIFPPHGQIWIFRGIFILYTTVKPSQTDQKCWNYVTFLSSDVEQQIFFCVASRQTTNRWRLADRNAARHSTRSEQVSSITIL